MIINEEEIVKLFVADTFIVSCNKLGGLKEYIIKKHAWNDTQYREYLSVYMNNIYKVKIQK